MYDSGNGGNGAAQAQKISLIFFKGGEKLAYYAVAVAKMRAVHGENGYGRSTLNRYIRCCLVYDILEPVGFG
jgi:hypothetical protein